MDEYDSPWKEALDEYFESFLQLCFPDVHREIAWTRGYVPLDKELQKIAPKGEVGQRVADKLMRVWRNSGDEEWIMVHVEVQSQKQVCCRRFEMSSSDRSHARQSVGDPTDSHALASVATGHRKLAAV